MSAGRPEGMEWNPASAGITGEVEWNPASACMDASDELPSFTLGKKFGNDGPSSRGSEQCSETSTDSPQVNSDMDGESHSSFPSPVAI